MSRDLRELVAPGQLATTLTTQQYGQQAKSLIQSGRSARAFELCREGLRHYPGEALLEFYEALALARGGNPTRANQAVTQLLDRDDLQSSLRVEVLSLGGRLAKDRIRGEASAAMRRKYAHEAAQWYQSAYELSHDVFPGVNAATMLMLSGRIREARHIAAEVVSQATRELALADRESDYWLFATLGEASLVLGQAAQAQESYARAVTLACGHLGDIASMRRNLLMLAERVDVPEEMLRLVDVGSVVVFSGHMVDHPSRIERGQPTRFPRSQELERALAAAIAGELERLKVVAGFSSAACGSDILFAEQMLLRGAELHLVLPFDRDDFYCTSVDFGLNVMDSWRERCDRVLGSAEVHYATNEHFLGDESLFEFTNTLTQGLTLLRAQELEAAPQALVVADGLSERQAPHPLGGSVRFLQSWRNGGRPAAVINLAQVRERIPTPARANERLSRQPAREPLQGSSRRRVKAMLFADVKNFSKLHEEQAPAFSQHFLAGVARLIDSAPEKPVFQNTWGDGLFLVFNHVVACAELAWRLLRRVEAVKWSRWGLPEDTTVRIGLHAGPVYPRLDKVIGRQNYFGSHVNRAARIEPVTTPGCAFTTEQFAALLAVEDHHAFTCEYIGVEQLAKDYDRCALYRLVRSGAR